MTTAQAGTGRTVTTDIPARLDRLPWSRWHWTIVLGLGTVWILDGLEVTVVGNIASRLSEPGSGLPITSGQVTGMAAALYVAGACTGALFWGRLTDKWGRKKLFMITLAVYLAATALTSIAFDTWWFFTFRFLTGFGIGGEYAAINSAIDELIPKEYRGRTDLMINGSFWLGAVGGSLLAIVALDTDVFAANVGWRLTFALGAVLALVILLVRRRRPGEPPLAADPRPRRRGGTHRLLHRTQDRGGAGRAAAAPGGRDHHPPAPQRLLPGDRPHGLLRLPPPRDPRLLPLHRPGLPLQRHHLRLRRDPDDVLRRPERQHRLLLRGHRTGQLLRPAAPGQALRHGGPPDHDLRHLSALRPAPLRHGLALRPGLAERGHDDGVLVRGPLLRLGGRVQRLPDGLRGLPDGDPRHVHRLLLRHRHRRSAASAARSSSPSSRNPVSSATRSSPSRSARP